LSSPATNGNTATVTTSTTTTTATISSIPKDIDFEDMHHRAELDFASDSLSLGSSRGTDNNDLKEELHKLGLRPMPANAANNRSITATLSTSPGADNDDWEAELRKELEEVGELKIK
jgi:hypothetical protein